MSRRFFCAGASVTRRAGFTSAARTSTMSPIPTPAFPRSSPSSRMIRRPLSSGYGGSAMAAVLRFPTISMMPPSRRPSAVSVSWLTRAVPRPTSCGFAPATCSRSTRPPRSASLIGPSPGLWKVRRHGTAPPGTPARTGLRTHSRHTPAAGPAPAPTAQPPRPASARSVRPPYSYSYSCSYSILNRPGFAGGRNFRGIGVMNEAKRYSREIRERAVRLVLGPEGEYPSQWAAIELIAEKIGCSSDTLRRWVRQAERDEGKRPGARTAELERIKGLERENRELRRANEILRKAAAFFAQAELDRGLR